MTFPDKIKANSFKTPLYLSLILLIWMASLVLPHFQSASDIPFLFVSAFLFVLIFKTLSKLPYLKTAINKVHLILLGTVFLVEVLLIGLALLGINMPYLYLSRLGSYTMFRNETLIIFGDLRHLTSVVNCPKEIKVGQDICDIWGRHFNQNADVGQLFRYFNLSNAEFIGILTLVVFFLTVLAALSRFKLNVNILISIFFTPPIILAIDRGNEIITITLILISVVINSRNSNSKCPVVLLGLAGVFKFWPFIILISWIILSRNFSIRAKILYSSICIAYLAYHVKNLKLIASETQRGDSNGGSFGIALLDYNSLYGFTMILFIVVGAFFLIHAMSKHERDLQELFKRDSLLIALILAFLGLYVFGSHFNYRLIILIPVALIFWKSLTNLTIPYFIFAVMITSRLNIVVVSTSILSLYFVYILSKYLLFALKSRIQFD